MADGYHTGQCKRCSATVFRAFLIHDFYPFFFVLLNPKRIHILLIFKFINSASRVPSISCLLRHLLNILIQSYFTPSGALSSWHTVPSYFDYPGMSSRMSGLGLRIFIKFSPISSSKSVSLETLCSESSEGASTLELLSLLLFCLSVTALSAWSFR